MDKKLSIEDLRAMAQGLLLEAQRTTQQGRKRLPYYQERYAKWAAELIDKVVSSGKPYCIPVGDLTANSIRLQWCQATKYLVDYLDADGKWAEKYSLLETSHSKRGTTISPKRKTGLLKAYQTEDWKTELLKWVDEVQPASGSGSDLPIFERIGLGFSQEDAKWIRDYFSPLDDLFVYDISIPKDTLKVVRVDITRAEEILNED